MTEGAELAALSVQSASALLKSKRVSPPAAFCGIVGLKATFGRVSARGVIPLASSLDHIGPLARTAADCGHVLDAIAGYDPVDRTSIDRPIDLESISQDLKGIRLGLPREFFYAQLHPEVGEAVAPPWRERLTLAIAHAYQTATDWHTRVPPLP